MAEELWTLVHMQAAPLAGQPLGSCAHFLHLFMELLLHPALPELQETADMGLKELEQSCCQPWLGRWAGAVVA